MAYVSLVTNGGLGIINNRLMGSGTSPKYVGWGIGTDEAAATDVGLQTASAEARTSGTESRVTTTTTNDTYQVVGEIVSLSTQAITEVVLMDADTSGNCFMRANFAALNLVAGDSIEFTIKCIADQA